MKKPPKRIWVVIDTEPVGKWPNDSGLPQGKPAHTRADLRYENQEILGYPELIEVPYILDPEWSPPTKDATDERIPHRSETAGTDTNALARAVFDRISFTDYSVSDIEEEIRAFMTTTGSGAP